jgi:hypothetical protein
LSPVRNVKRVDHLNVEHLHYSTLNKRKSENIFRIALIYFNIEEPQIKALAYFDVLTLLV